MTSFKVMLLIEKLSTHTSETLLHNHVIVIKLLALQIFK